MTKPTKLAVSIALVLTTLGSVVAPIATHLSDKSHERKMVAQEHKNALLVSEQKHQHSVQGYLHSLTDYKNQVAVLRDDLAIAQGWEGKYNDLIILERSKCPPRSDFNVAQLMCIPMKRPKHL